MLLCTPSGHIGVLSKVQFYSSLGSVIILFHHGNCVCCLFDGYFLAIVDINAWPVGLAVDAAAVEGEPERFEV